jgi:shikimate kinase
MKNIILIGFMGSGKSVISGALAKKTKRKVLDTDALIEATAGMRIKRVFAMYGEAYFRKLEAAAAGAAAEEQNAIIATGGGIVTRPANIKALKKNGAIIYLKNSFEVSAKRLKGRDDRPLFDYKNLEKTKELFKKRQPLYKAAADIIIETDKKSASRVVDEIIKKGGKKGWL